ncbi:MAG: cytochrome c [Bacteroidetes bacterium]|nr:cytochrome c [Bacteroidota bacterium]
MKKIIILFIFVMSGSAMLFSSCAPTKEIADKSGAQLWGENCNRCHNAPSMDQYSKEQWPIIGSHMKLKAGLTDDEVNKIVSFLKGS